jgi:hypothetical protein
LSNVASSLPTSRRSKAEPEELLFN